MTIKKNNGQYTWARAFRDVFVAAINKGQLPILGVIGVFFIILWRIPESNLAKVLESIIDHLVKGELIAYILLFVSCTGWFIHAKVMRTNFTQETNRIAEEKTRLQNKANRKTFKSSED